MRIVKILFVAAVCLGCVSAQAGEFTMQHGGKVLLGQWYEISGCAQTGTARVRITQQPVLGRLKETMVREAPNRPEQAAQCPGLKVATTKLHYKSKHPGDDHFAFTVDFNPPLPGNYDFNDTVHVQ